MVQGRERRRRPNAQESRMARTRDRCLLEMRREKKILVIGGTGFLGTNIIENLRMENPDSVWYTTRQNIKDPYAINVDFQELTPDRFGILDFDIVIHNAAYLPKPEDKQDPLCDAVNSEGLKHVFDMYKDVCKHFIFISSLSVYSGLEKSDITEDTPVFLIL